MQKKVTDFFAANKPVYHTPMPHKSRTEAGSDDLAERVRASVKEEDRERLRRDHLKLDLAQQKAMDDFDKKLKAFWPADLKLTAPVPDDLNPRK
ncbi:MAG: hypothetical protein WCB11_11930 [Terriglobales bacterium]|jgi:hypothetical protein